MSPPCAAPPFPVQRWWGRAEGGWSARFAVLSQCSNCVPPLFLPLCCARICCTSQPSGGVGPRAVSPADAPAHSSAPGKPTPAAVSRIPVPSRRRAKSQGRAAATPSLSLSAGGSDSDQDGHAGAGRGLPRDARPPRADPGDTDLYQASPVRGSQPSGASVVGAPAGASPVMPPTLARALQMRRSLLNPPEQAQAVSTSQAAQAQAAPFGVPRSACGTFLGICGAASEFSRARPAPSFPCGYRNLWPNPVCRAVAVRARRRQRSVRHPRP